MGGVAERTTAPWSDDQVASLNEYQTSGVFHPFTCHRCRDVLGTWSVRYADGRVEPLPPTSDEWQASEEVVGVEVSDRLLVATRDGWICPTCPLTQEWAWAWMADGSWRRLRLFESPN